MRIDKELILDMEKSINSFKSDLNRCKKTLSYIHYDRALKRLNFKVKSTISKMNEKYNVNTGVLLK